MKKILALVAIVVIGVGVWKFSENKETTIQGPGMTPADQAVGVTKTAGDSTVAEKAKAKAKAAEDAKKSDECIKDAGSDATKMVKCAESFSPAAGGARSLSGSSPTTQCPSDSRGAACCLPKTLQNGVCA